MKRFHYFIYTALSVFCLSNLPSAQTTNFNLQLYKQFLQENKDMSTQTLLDIHPAGLFSDQISPDWEAALYADSIILKYNLSEDEINLINKHGFVVTKRLQRESIGGQLIDIFHKDLPVFISTDAILHAFHSSYDRILKDVELHVLIPELRNFLAVLHAQLPILIQKHQGNEHLMQSLRDIDVYLTIPRKLMDPGIDPLMPENSTVINELLGYISDEQFRSINFFAETPRKIDFSQFKPRGHYTDNFHPELADYFRAMIWLGRMEIYLIPPRSLDLKPKFRDIQRQIIDAFFIKELIDLAEARAVYDKIESIIAFFVGEQDNVTIDNIYDLAVNINLADAVGLLDSLKVIEFQDSLALQPFAQQRILSQVLMNDPANPDSIIPASAFLIFGQRFIIDSYVTGNVVFDRIRYQNRAIIRLQPKTLDIFFALGNDATAQLLQPELDEYHYAQNLAGLRYLIDSYEPAFWESTIYNMWLGAIRTLNPPAERKQLPDFMQTAAWWQEKLNTQLAAWTELRHDNLLYAKQSYTGGVTCQFPFSYVEPIPEFYAAMRLMAANINSEMQNMPFDVGSFRDYVNRHFVHWESTMDTLEKISVKELSGGAYSTEEINFLQKMLREEQICGVQYDGWFTHLYYEPWDYESGLLKKDYLVADYHTTPTDEFGNFVGWVAHAGTGPVDMAILAAKIPSGETVAFIGPVLSYYEYTTTNFERLTDEEWQSTYLTQALHPDWVNLYMADAKGTIMPDGAKLMTGTHDDPGENPSLPENYLLATNYPNPFNDGTIIRYHIPVPLAGQKARLAVYDINGRMVTKLLERSLPAGNYLTRWDGRDQSGISVASGVYFYALRVGDGQYIGKMHLIR